MPFLKQVGRREVIVNRPLYVFALLLKGRMDNEEVIIGSIVSWLNFYCCIC